MRGRGYTPSNRAAPPIPSTSRHILPSPMSSLNLNALILIIARQVGREIMYNLRTAGITATPPVAAPPTARHIVPPAPMANVTPVQHSQPPSAKPLVNNPNDPDIDYTLLSHFPEVKASTIVAITQHKFHERDLYTLDPRHKNKTEHRTPNGPILELDLALKNYSSLDAILVPLQTYFSILVMHAEEADRSATVAWSLFRYNAHLATVANEYEWPAVVEYHMAFFAKRRREMCEGEYRGWEGMDRELRAQYLFLYRKPLKA